MYILHISQIRPCLEYLYLGGLHLLQQFICLIPLRKSNKTYQRLRFILQTLNSCHHRIGICRYFHGFFSEVLSCSIIPSLIVPTRSTKAASDIHCSLSSCRSIELPSIHNHSFLRSPNLNFF